MIDMKFAAHLCSVIYGLMLVAPGVEARGAAPGAKLTIIHPADRGSLPLTKPIAAKNPSKNYSVIVGRGWMV